MATWVSVHCPWESGIGDGGMLHLLNKTVSLSFSAFSFTSTVEIKYVLGSMCRITVLYHVFGTPSKIKFGIMG